MSTKLMLAVAAALTILPIFQAGAQAYTVVRTLPVVVRPGHTVVVHPRVHRMIIRRRLMLPVRPVYIR